MFAYCNNNPAKCSDPSGKAPVWDTSSYSCLSGGIGPDSAFAKYLELLEAYRKMGVELFSTIEGALKAWSDVYLSRSEEYEHVTLLYSIETLMGTRYFTSRTYKGSKGNAIMSANVIWGTIMLWIENSISAANLIAQVHTHPDPGNKCNSFPSWQPGIYGGDRIAMELFGFPDMYIIPYNKCPSCPGWFIKYSDRSTWCLDYKN